MTVIGFCLLSATEAQAFSLTPKDVKQLEAYLQAISDRLGNYIEGHIPTEFKFRNGYCENVELKRYDPLLVKLTLLSDQSFRIRILDGLVEANAFCKFCVKILEIIRICAKGTPTA